MTRCRVCNRPLKSEKSEITGLGPTCREHRSAIDQPELFGDENPPMLEDVIDWDKLRSRSLIVDEQEVL